MLWFTYQNLSMQKVDYVVGIESMGFILGTLIAAELKGDFIALRKAGRLPYGSDQLISVEYSDYQKKSGSKTMQLEKDVLFGSDNVLIVDDWIETGRSMKAGIQPLTQTGANTIGISVIGCDRNEFTQDLIEKKLLKYIAMED